jgi:Flp pilus assembly pilin Flp
MLISRIVYYSLECFMTRYFVQITNLVKDFHQREDQGGVAAEYGVLLAGIVALVAVAALALGGRISGLFDTILP